MWFVIWLVCMMFWLFGGGAYVYNRPERDMVLFGTGTLLPWICVLLAGLAAFGVIHPTPIQM